MNKYQKIVSILFIIAFAGIITIPPVLTNFEDGKMSVAENRILTSKPVLKLDDGSINPNYINDFESWFNDNIGLRKYMYIMDARIQYYIFNELISEDNFIGPNGELNFAEDFMFENYAHVDLYSDEELTSFADSFQTLSDYVEDQGVAFIYFQCYDKHSIYPEYFSQSINQYGNISATDQFVDTIKNKTTVDIIDPKEALLSAKDQYNVFSIWGDPAHWSPRGSFVGYQMLIDEINKSTGKDYKVLTEDDFNITMNDQGKYMLGCIHEVDMEENFELKEPHAVQTDEAPLFLSPNAYFSRTIYENDAVDNNDTIVIIGDSYFEYHMFPQLAESFSRTVQIWGDYYNEIPAIIEYYHPTVIVAENAERCARYPDIVSAVETFSSNE